MGKELEGLLARRQSWWAEQEGRLNPRQHGYRAGKSREMLVEHVVSQAEEAMDGGQVLLAVVFDVDGAFNKSWHWVICWQGWRRGTARLVCSASRSASCGTGMQLAGQLGMKPQRS